MIRVLLNTDGTIQSILGGFIEQVQLNTPSNALFVDQDTKPLMTSYWDFDQHQFIEIGEAPTPYHQFSYNAKEWFDPRTLIDLKNQKWEQLKKSRDALEFGGFEFEGHIYDSDQTSQGRIMGAALAGVDQVWTLKDNSIRLLTADQLKQLYAAMAQHVTQSHERGRIARAAVEAAQTKEEVEAVTL